jgi:threonine/homoserine/homoserine lactone efflux protein
MFSQISLYIFSLGLAAILPGPGMTGLLFKTLSQDSKHGFLMLFGLITGDLIYLSTSIFGLSFFQRFNPNFIDYIQVLSSIYLIYLAYKFWTFNGSNISSFSPKPLINLKFLSYFDGLIITLSNPKTISFYLALLPAIFPLSNTISPQLFLIIVICTVLTLLIIGGLYIIFALKMKSKLQNIRTQRMIFKFTAIFMFCLAIKLLHQI